MVTNEFEFSFCNHLVNDNRFYLRRMVMQFLIHVIFYCEYRRVHSRIWTQKLSADDTFSSIFHYTGVYIWYIFFFFFSLISYILCLLFRLPASFFTQDGNIWILNYTIKLILWKYCTSIVGHSYTKKRFQLKWICHSKWKEHMKWKF